MKTRPIDQGCNKIVVILHGSGKKGPFPGGPSRSNARTKVESIMHEISRMAALGGGCYKKRGYFFADTHFHERENESATHVE